MATKAKKVLDLSSDKIYVVIYYEEGDPGSKFDIYHRSKIAGDPEKCLKKFSHVCIICGVYRCHGIVAEISDDYDYLNQKLEAIKEEFLVAYYQNSAKSGKLSTFHPSPNRIVKEFIKIADKETQTEETQELLEMQGKYEALTLKYVDLKGAMDAIYSGVENSLGHIGRQMPSRRRTLSPTTSDSDDSTRSKALKIETVSPNSTPGTNAYAQSSDDDFRPNVDKVTIGSGKSTVPRRVYESINWNSYSAATRKLLMSLFDRSILATHSLTGKPSPAFIGTPKQPKERLDSIKVADIVETVSKKCGVSPSLVRGAITTKCADENKMFKKRKEKNKENTEPEEIKKPRLE